jgi:cell division protein FtsQ
MWNNARALDRMSGVVFALAILMLFAAMAWRAAHFEAFSVREIDVVGDVTRVTREQVETIVFNELEGTFFTVDLGAAKAAFEKLPWVRRVDVRRRWPNRLEVAVEEHRELARWGNSAMVNRYGEVFEGASNDRLPKFEGPDGSCVEVTRNYMLFNEALRLIGRRVETVRVSERRAWRVRLDDGTVIELGRDGVVARLNNYVAAYGRSVARLKGGARHVDMRYANGFSVRVKDLRWSDTRA